MRSDSARIGLALRSRPDLHALVRTLAQWADLRPVVGEVILFGDRVRGAPHGESPVEVAVRYDPLGLDEGFDDWIEQLRTGFSDLHERVRQPIEVALPNHSDAWPLIARGTDLDGLARGKVRCVVTPPRGAHRPDAANMQGHRDMGVAVHTLWRRLTGHLPFRMPNASLISGRRTH